MNVFLWNARARNGHVEATLNHPFPAQDLVAASADADAAAVAAAADAHSQAGIAAMAHMASAFVEVARQSRHQPNPEQLIDRFPSQDLLRTVDLIPPKIMQTFVFTF